MPRDARCCSARCEVSIRVGWAAVGFGAGDLAVLLYVLIALPLVGAQTLGVAGSERRATRQHRAAVDEQNRVARESGGKEGGMHSASCTPCGPSLRARRRAASTGSSTSATARGRIGARAARHSSPMATSVPPSRSSGSRAASALAGARLDSHVYSRKLGECTLHPRTKISRIYVPFFRSSWRLRILATRRGARAPTSDRTLHRDTSCAPYARASLLIQLYDSSSSTKHSFAPSWQDATCAEAR